MTRVPFLCDDKESLRWEFFQTKRAYALPLATSLLAAAFVAVPMVRRAYESAEGFFSIIFLPFSWLVFGTALLLVWVLPMWNQRRSWRAGITNRAISVRPLGKPYARQDLPLGEIGKIHHHRSFFGEPFGYGTITLYPKETSQAKPLTLRGITRSRNATLLLLAVAKSGGAPPPPLPVAPSLESGEQIRQRFRRMAWGYAEPFFFSAVFLAGYFFAAYYPVINWQRLDVYQKALGAGILFAPYLVLVTLPWFIGVALFRRRFRVLLTNHRLIVRDHGLHNAIALDAITAATLRRTRLGRIFNYGDLVIEGNQGELFTLENLARASSAHEILAKAVRIARGDYETSASSS